MKEIEKLNYLYKIEEVNRHGEVNQRRESTAEHICTSIILANYFLESIEEKLEYKKVIQMLLFHDHIEIEVGDININNSVEKLKAKEEEEKLAFKIVKNKFPKVLQKIYEELWKEFLENKTREAKFVNAIEKLDPVIQAFNKKYLWKKYNFTEELLRDRKQKYFEEFPIILNLFEEILDYFRENEYF